MRIRQRRTAPCSTAMTSAGTARWVSSPFQKTSTWSPTCTTTCSRNSPADGRTEITPSWTTSTRELTEMLRPTGATSASVCSSGWSTPGTLPGTLVMGPLRYLCHRARADPCPRARTPRLGTVAARYRDRPRRPSPTRRVAQPSHDFSTGHRPGTEDEEAKRRRSHPEGAGEVGHTGSDARGQSASRAAPGRLTAQRVSGTLPHHEVPDDGAAGRDDGHGSARATGGGGGSRGGKATARTGHHRLAHLPQHGRLARRGVPGTAQRGEPGGCRGGRGRRGGRRSGAGHRAPGDQRAGRSRGGPAERRRGPARLRTAVLQPPAAARAGGRGGQGTRDSAPPHREDPRDAARGRSVAPAEEPQAESLTVAPWWTCRAQWAQQ